MSRRSPDGIVRLTGEDAIKLLTLHTALMRTSVSLYHRHRFPAEFISHCVWLYFRFALSFRDIEEMLAMRGVILTYETVRECCLKFGQTYANDLRRRSPRAGDRWHLDEVFLKINGRIHYLWRAVDQDGEVLDILVQSRRDKKAAKEVLSQAFKRITLCPASDHHRQAEELQCGKDRSAAQCRALPSEVSEQSRRELTSTNEIAGACDETVQVIRTRAAFSLGLWNHCVTLPRRETSVQSSRLSGSDEVETRIMGCGHLHLGAINYQLTKVGFIS
jgi:DDE domain